MLAARVKLDSWKWFCITWLQSTIYRYLRCKTEALRLTNNDSNWTKSLTILEKWKSRNRLTNSSNSKLKKSYRYNKEKKCTKKDWHKSRIERYLILPYLVKIWIPRMNRKSKCPNKKSNSFYISMRWELVRESSWKILYTGSYINSIILRNLKTSRNEIVFPPLPQK